MATLGIAYVIEVAPTFLDQEYPKMYVARWNLLPGDSEPCLQLGTAMMFTDKSVAEEWLAAIPSLSGLNPTVKTVHLTIQD